MARKRGGGESSVGLIVTLIFFILTSIGLGVATYYGFAQQAQLTDDKNKADAAKKEADLRADWYQFQALTYRTYLGQTTGMGDPSDPKDPKSLTLDAQLKLLRDKYDKNQLGADSKGTDYPDKAGVVKLIQTMESKAFTVQPEDKDKKQPAVVLSMAWDADKKRPRASYDDVFNALFKLNTTYQTQADAAAAARDAALAAQKTAEDAQQKDKATFKTQVDELGKKYEADLVKLNEDLNARAADLAAANKALGDAKLAGEDALKAKQKEIVAKEAAIKELQDRLNELNERVAVTQKKTEEAPANGKPIPTDWKIVQMDRSGKQPFINLGSSQNVHPGLTFSIHGQGPDGKPLPESKGTLEVLNVVNENLSQAQVVSVKDEFKDPILPGDYLYNPIFHPGAQQHVAIAGPVHLHGTKADDLDEFERVLKRQNVVVDAYVDPQDGSIKGRLTVGTDYLILGDIADVKEGTPLATSVKTLQEQAQSNGVRIISAREFLDLTGYRAP